LRVLMMMMMVYYDDDGVLISMVEMMKRSFNNATINEIMTVHMDRRLWNFFQPTRIKEELTGFAALNSNRRE
jgi:hypothetical protein